MTGSPLLVRARDAEGRFLADDPSTPDVNEAWVAMPLTKDSTGAVA